MDMGEVAGDNITRLLGDRRLRRFRAAPMPMLISFGDITTWLVAGESVVASPVLAAAKEGVYQATMARLESPQRTAPLFGGCRGPGGDGHAAAAAAAANATQAVPRAYGKPHRFLSRV